MQFACRFAPIGRGAIDLEYAKAFLQVDDLLLSGPADILQCMPSALHEAIVELFRYRPSLVRELVELLGAKPPDYQGWSPAI